MDRAVLWYLAIGLFLIVMVCLGTALKRMPLTSAIFYLAFGVAMGPHGLNLLRLNFFEEAEVLERLMGAAVVVSLFTAGLKMRMSLKNPQWKTALRLATLSMLVSIVLIAGAGYWVLSLPLGSAVILAAILSPTDPVLASDVQITEPGDRDKLRFALTGEAGLNDGTAFPFMLLGLGLLGFRPLGSFGETWFLLDVLWACAVGLGVGYLLGMAIGQLVLFLRRRYKKALGLEEFLSLGLIALSYGTMELLHANGFLGVFAAGLALRRLEHHQVGEQVLGHEQLTGPEEVVATDPDRASSFLTKAVLSSNEQLERLLEVAVVLIIGSLISFSIFTSRSILFALLLFCIIRPISVWLGLWGTNSTNQLQRNLISWFGIRGLGSIYYMAYAVHHGLSPAMGREMVSVTLCIVVISILIHGVSVTPLMEAYEKKEKRIRMLRAVFSRK